MRRGCPQRRVNSPYGTRKLRGGQQSQGQSKHQKTTTQIKTVVLCMARLTRRRETSCSERWTRMGGNHCKTEEAPRRKSAICIIEKKNERYRGGGDKVRDASHGFHDRSHRGQGLGVGVGVLGVGCGIYPQHNSAVKELPALEHSLRCAGELFS